MEDQNGQGVDVKEGERSEVGDQRSEIGRGEQWTPGDLIEIHSQVPLPQGLWFKASGTITMKMKVVAGASGELILDILVYHNGKSPQKVIHMCKEDNFSMTHTWSSVDGPLKNPHFPLEIYWKGQRYLLNETRSGKLILTK